MKAVLLQADWAPRAGHRLTERESATHKVMNASMAFKNPRVQVADMPVPVAQADDLLVRVKTCGYCGSDVHCVEKGADDYVLYTARLTSPIILGHEFSGVVERVGDAVTDFSPGDMVTAEQMQWCGECRACRRGLFNQCRRVQSLGFNIPGAMAEYLAVKAKYAWKIGPLISVYGDEEKAFEAGALVEPTGVAYNAIFVEGGGIRPGDDVAVFGAGPIGLAAVALLRAAGAAEIIAFEVNERRRRLAELMGATAVYDPTALKARQVSLADVMLELTDGSGVQMMLDVTGAPQQVFPDATRGGDVDHKTIVAGLGPDPVSVNFLDLILPGARMFGSVGHSGSGIFGSVIKMMKSKRIDMTPIITHRVSLDDALDGFKRLAARDEAKVMIRI